VNRILTVLAAVVISAAPPSSSGAQSAANVGQAKQSPDALAKALQTRYQSIRDFSADFVQSYRAGVLKTQTQERGTVVVKKPGKMHWTYSKPERKELVSDGVKLYWYEPEIKQVIVRDVADQASTPDLFLSGRGDIVRDFSASSVESPIAGTTALKLTPRRSEPEYQYLILAVDPVSLQLRALTTRDHQGGESTLTFSNMKENRGVSDKEFVFRTPRGVKVVTDSTR
jgi:outer membrane lipoprotein carrier protein